MKQVYLYILLSFFSVSLVAQNAKIDSLRKLVVASAADTNQVNTLLELSWQYLIIGEYNKSISEAEAANKIAQQIGFRKGEAASYFSKGSSYLYKGEHSKALDYYFKSLKIVEILKDETAIAKHYSNIGNVYYSLTDYANALIYYQKAFELVDNQEDNTKAPAFLVNIGNVYNEQKNYDKALEYYMKSLDWYSKAKNTSQEAIVLGNIGNALCLKGDHNKALEYYNKALKIRAELGDKRGLENNLGNIGGVYMYLGKDLEAEEYINKAIAIAFEIGDNEGLMYYYNSLSELFAKKQDWTQSLKQYKKYVAIKDSLFNETKSSQIAEMQTKFDLDKKEKELSLYKQEEKLTMYKAYFLAIVLLLVSLLTVLLVNRQRIKIKKQKEAHELEQQLAQNEIERAELEKKNLEANLSLKLEKLNHITDLFKEKSKLMDKMEEQLNKLKAENAEEKGVNLLLTSIEEYINPNEYWEEFITSFNLVNKNFFDQILRMYPELTKNELRLCALIKCNLGNKEIANVLNITADSVKKSRNRLRKRLQLEADDSLTKYIQFLN